MGEQVCDLLPVSLGLDVLQSKALDDRLARDRKLQCQKSGMQRRLTARRALLLRASLSIMRVSQEGGDNRGDERGMHERLQERGLSESTSSRRCTDLSNLMLSSTSQRAR